MVTLIGKALVSDLPKDNLGLNSFFLNCGWSTSSSLFPSSYLKISYILKATINAQFESKGSLLKIVLPKPKENGSHLQPLASALLRFTCSGSDAPPPPITTS